MKKIYSKKIKKSLKSGNKWLILTIISLLITLGFVIWAIIVSQSKSKYLNDVIMKDKNEEGVYACVNVTAIPYAFAKTSTEKRENRYYFIRDDSYFYIAYLDYTTFKSLNYESIEDNPKTICGVTSLIDKDIKKIAIDVYNEDMESEIVNYSNFNNYFGGVYLNTISEINDPTIQICLSVILGSFTMVIGIITALYKIKTKRFIKNLTTEEWEQINNEIESSDTKYYKQAETYLTKNYLIDLSSGLYAIKYSNIVWLYPYELRHNGILFAENLVIFDKHFTRNLVAGIKMSKKKGQQIFNEIADEILNKNKSIIWGFNSKSIQQFNELKQNKKD